jgi:hypothetical protein
MKRYIKSSYRSVDPEELETKIEELKQKLKNPNLSYEERDGLYGLLEIYKGELSDSYDYNRDPYQWEL